MFCRTFFLFTLSFNFVHSKICIVLLIELLYIPNEKLSLSSNSSGKIRVIGFSITNNKCSETLNNRLYSCIDKLP